MFWSIFRQTTCEKLLKREKLRSDLEVIQGSNEAEAFGATSGGSQHTFSPEPGALHREEDNNDSLEIKAAGSRINTQKLFLNQLQGGDVVCTKTHLFFHVDCLFKQHVTS